MISQLLSGDGLREFLIQALLSIPIILFSLSVHETAHGYVAYKLGDPTAHSLGRLSLNPLKHIDPLGFICMLLCGFGWAKPVPINTRYFKNPRWGMALTSLAGPVSNLILAVIFSVIYWITVLIRGFWSIEPPEYVFMFFLLGVTLNVTLAVFNFIPIPPLDGSRILCAFLPQKAAYWFIKNERIISIVLMVALVVGVLDPVISFFSNIVTSVLLDIPAYIILLVDYLITLF